MRSRIASIENLISKDPNRRNIFRLVQRDHLRLAALSLLRAERVLIVSGFPIAQAGAGETDGPPGAWALGRAMAALGIPVAYLTDRYSAPLFDALGAKPLLTWEKELLSRETFSHLVAVERPGRARDGRYYDMRGMDITDCVEPLDELFMEAESRGLVTVGIGDGGNEVGMGRVFRGVARAVRHGDRIASTVLTDYVIVSGVSNWGAYGLVGALSVLGGSDLLPSVTEVSRSIERCVEAGGVDGVSGRRVHRADGTPVSLSLEILQDIRWHLLPSPLGRLAGLKAGVIGGGVSGLAAARLLLNRGARVRLSDQCRVEVPPDLRDCAWETGGHTLSFLRETDLVVRSPGVPHDHPVVQNLREIGIPVLSELEVAYQLGRPSLVAVTGSIGKRSTVRILGELADRCGFPIKTGGNKGEPLSRLVQEDQKGWIALAVSSFQLESIVRFRPHIAVILNISSPHLDRHRDLSETVRIKSRIFLNQSAADYLILNRDDAHLTHLAEKHWGETLYVSAQAPQERGIWLENGEIVYSMGGRSGVLGRAPDRHPEDVLSAALIGILLGIPTDAMTEPVGGLCPSA